MNICDQNIGTVTYLQEGALAVLVLSWKCPLNIVAVQLILVRVSCVGHCSCTAVELDALALCILLRPFTGLHIAYALAINI